MKRSPACYRQSLPLGSEPSNAQLAIVACRLEVAVLGLVMTGNTAASSAELGLARASIF